MPPWEERVHGRESTNKVEGKEAAAHHGSGMYKLRATENIRYASSRLTLGERKETAAHHRIRYVQVESDPTPPRVVSTQEKEKKVLRRNPTDDQTWPNKKHDMHRQRLDEKEDKTPRAHACVPNTPHQHFFGLPNCRDFIGEPVRNTTTYTTSKRDVRIEKSPASGDKSHR